jgi:nucleoside-diphosphate-sugar epimerase
VTVLITGGGLVGSQLARLEVEAGRCPVIFDSAPRVDALADIVDVERCVVVRGDVTRPFDLVAAVEQHRVRRIVHTAAYGGLTAGGRQAPLATTEVNVLGTAHVLEVARLFGLDRVVLASSSTLYASLEGGEDGGTPGMEEAYPRPSTVYAATKQASEDLGRAYRGQFGLDVVTVRYAAVFGPWAPGGGGVPTAAMERWLRGAVAGGPVDVETFVPDWIYSKDAAHGTQLACWADGLASHTFNLSMGRHHGAPEIAAVLAELVPGATVRAVPPRAAGGGARAARPMRINRARQELSFDVRYPMPAALADYREWLERHPGPTG